jgi:nucleotide-binding universal stress UspA family protein
VNKKNVENFCDKYYQNASNFKKVTVTGYPVVEILNVFESEDTDIVVLGTYGCNAVEHVVFGSVAENVVKNHLLPTHY